MSENHIINEIKKHLGQYKREQLKILEDGIYSYRGNDVFHDYILPKELENENIIKSSFYDVIQNNIPSNKRHFLFNHLNSSQALCTNLFSPLLCNNFQNLKIILDSKPQGILLFEFEHSDDVIKDNSNFDLFIETVEHKRLYFEIKYTEDSLYTKSSSKKNDLRWNNIYSTLFTKILKNKAFLSKEHFFSQYQLWRNICRIAIDENEVYFVFPEFRQKLRKQVEDAIQKLKPEAASKVHILTIDNICNTVLNHGDKNIRGHYLEFKSKYLPPIVYNKI